MTPANHGEILDRVRRIETRVTTIAIALGIGSASEKPRFVPAAVNEPLPRVILPSPHASLESIRRALPEDFSGRLFLIVGEEPVGILDV